MWLLRNKANKRTPTPTRLGFLLCQAVSIFSLFSCRRKISLIRMRGRQRLSLLGQSVTPYLDSRVERTRDTASLLT